MNELLFVIPLFIYCLSGICDAIVDTLEFHYSESIFTKYNPQIWDISKSWTNKYIDHDESKGVRKVNILWIIKIDVPVQFTDAFHFFKMLREGFYTASITAALCVGTYFTSIQWYVLLIFFCVVGESRNKVFNQVFNKILIK